MWTKVYIEGAFNFINFVTEFYLREYALGESKHFLLKMCLNNSLF